MIALEAPAKTPTANDAQRFAEGIAARLGIMAEYAQPAFEDPADRMLSQGAVAENIDANDPKIDDPQERARILRSFDTHLTQPAGYVLPVQRASAKEKSGWLTEMWHTRRGRLFLLAGDSPLGLRLPLTSLPYFDPAEYPQLVPADPFAERGPLPAARAKVAATVGGNGEAPPLAPDEPRHSRVEGQGHPGAHGAVGRGARQAALHVHAANRTAGGLSRTAGGGRRHCGRTRTCRCRSKATRRRTIRASTTSR